MNSQRVVGRSGNSLCIDSDVLWFDSANDCVACVAEKRLEVKDAGHSSADLSNSALIIVTFPKKVPIDPGLCEASHALQEHRQKQHDPQFNPEGHRARARHRNVWS